MIVELAALLSVPCNLLPLGSALLTLVAQAPLACSHASLSLTGSKHTQQCRKALKTHIGDPYRRIFSVCPANSSCPRTASAGVVPWSLSRPCREQAGKQNVRPAAGSCNGAKAPSGPASS